MRHQAHTKQVRVRRDVSTHLPRATFCPQSDNLAVPAFSSVGFSVTEQLYAVFRQFFVADCYRERHANVEMAAKSFESSVFNV